jgi:membrane protease YdiL (CAAX protease family)
MNKILKNNRLIIYFVLAYLISGLFSLPLIINDTISKSLIYYILIFLAQCGPLFSAIIVITLYRKELPIKDFFKKSFNYRFPIYVYVLTLFIPFITMLLGELIGRSLTENYSAFLFMVPNTILTALIAPFSEELGWRGIATGELQKKFNPIITSVILGVIWAGWHYFFFLIPGSYSNNLPYILFLLSCIADTLWYTWLYNKSNGSVIPGMLFHFAYNLTYHIIPINPDYQNGDTTIYIATIIIEIISGIVVNILYMKNIKRK